MVFGERVKARRLALGLTQEDMIELTGKGQSQVWRYETGKTWPSAEVVRIFAIALGTSADYLVGLTNDPNRIAKNELTPDENELLRLLRGTMNPDQSTRTLIGLLRVLQK